MEALSLVLLLLLGCDAKDPGADGGTTSPCEEGTWYPDADEDGFGAADGAVEGCDPGAGWLEEGGDCDDGDAAIHPGAEEHCDEVDEDCDGAVDEDPVDPATWYTDADGDGWGAAAVQACTAPEGHVEVGGDCDDGDAAVSPDAAETWYDGVDQDCAGDDDFDADGDGWTVDGDCDDAHAEAHPGLVEVCGDGLDNDCDGGPNDCRVTGEVDLSSEAVVTWKAVGEITDGLAGRALVAGDTDGDGLSELLIGAPALVWPDSYDAGMALLVEAGATGLTLLTDSTLATWHSEDYELGDALAAGDLDGDGYDDLVVASGSGDASGLYDRGVAVVSFCPCAGDLAEADFDSILLGDEAHEGLGHAVAIPGDVTEDGIGDLLLGVPGVGGSAVGSVRVLSGPEVHDAAAVIDGTADVVLGSLIAAAGDLDGDGVGDFVLGGEGESTVALFYGPVDGRGSAAEADHFLTLFGIRALAGGGDVDGDGLSDLVIGSPGYGDSSSAPGAAFVLSGPVDADGSAASLGQQLIGHQDDQDFGRALSLVPDVDGDGLDEVLVGAPETDDGRGEAYLFYGPAAGGLTSEDPGLTLSYSGGNTGWAVLGLPAWDGDALGDVAIGVPEMVDGLVYVWLGVGL